MLVKFLKKIGIFLMKLGLLVGGFYLVIAIIFGILWLLVRNMEEKKVSGVKEQVEIILDESEESYVNRVGKLLYTKHDKNYKLTDHEIKFDRKYGSILVRVADSSLKFKYPYSLMVTTDWRDKVKKVNSFYFTLALTPQERIKNSEARTRIYELIQELNDAGWKRHLPLSSARIVGKEIYAYNQDSSFYDSITLDNKHRLNDEEWMSLSTYNWAFYYKDKAYLNIKVMREQKGRKIDADEGYFLLIDIDTISSAHCINLSDEYQKKSYLEKQEHWKNLRIKAEQKAIKAGYHIDYEYKDSPLNRGIFDLSKQCDDFDENVTCTKTGYWQSFLPEDSEYKKYKGFKGEIKFQERLTVFLDKNIPSEEMHKHLYWRYLGSAEEYELVEGELIKKEEKKKEKVISFQNGEVCPKNGYWQLFVHGLESKGQIGYFKKGKILTSYSSDPLAIIAQWKYLGDENDFEVSEGRLI